MKIIVSGGMNETLSLFSDMPVGFAYQVRKIRFEESWGNAGGIVGSR